MRRRAEGIMARGKRRQREEAAEEPDVEERYNECGKSPLICLATQDEEY